MEYNHFTYGLMLATKHKSLTPTQYFTCSESDNLQSLMERLSSVNATVLVALDGRNADFEDNDAERLTKRSQYFFMVLTPAAIDDSAAILAAQASAESIALQLQARMMADQRAYLNGLTCLVPGTFTIRGIGPVGDGLYGVIIGFNVDYGVTYSIDNTQWNA